MGIKEERFGDELTPGMRNDVTFGAGTRFGHLLEEEQTPPHILN